ncbi:methylated DNA-protein cysteine methyltransferase [Enterococcus innesii]|uniref:methylated DNA-protein cysteine methyltransferase n=1 Tax=Enterococcus innesii TaxID=2839759 RepID=UPI003984AFA6
MANEEKKDFNAMLWKKTDMPKIQTLTDPETIRKYGGSKMFFAPAPIYNDIMKLIPEGKLITVADIREYLAKQNNADFTDPMTAGIFISICAWASYQRNTDNIPFWRTLKSHGELNPKYPGGIEAQKEKLTAEGHSILQKGRKNIRYFVEDYQNSLFDLYGE